MREYDLYHMLAISTLAAVNMPVPNPYRATGLPVIAILNFLA